MTNERAIELLKRISDSQFDGEYGDERREALDMAVRALEGDGDTISRKMVIDAMRKLQKWNIMREDYKNVGFSYDDVMFTLEKLTSAQPKQYWIDSEGKISALPSGQIATDKNVGDTISRQQAIDIVRNRVKRFTTACVLAVTEIEKLPSAQPEVTEEAVKDYCRKRCLAILTNDYFHKLTSAQLQRKTGKWITVNGRLGNEVECENCHSVFWYWMGNYGFCPSCGARMDGESDGTD